MQHDDFRLPRPGLAAPLRLAAALAAVAVIIAAALAFSGGRAAAQDPANAEDANSLAARCAASRPTGDSADPINHVDECFTAPDIIKIWTSGPGPQGTRDIEDLAVFAEANQWTPANVSIFTGQGRYTTFNRIDSLTNAPDRLNDLFIRLRDPNTGNRLTYGDLTGVHINVSPLSDNFQFTMSNALWSGRTGKGLHQIDHPTRTVPAARRGGAQISGQTVPLKVCPTSVLTYSTQGIGGLAPRDGIPGWYDLNKDGDWNFVDTDGDGVRDFNDLNNDGVKDDGEEYTEEMEPTTNLETDVSISPCVIDAAAWRLLSGQTGALDSAPLPDLHLTFSVPASWSNIDSSVYLRVAHLSENYTCTRAERNAGDCDVAFSTWYESDPTAFLYRIDPDGRRCPVYQPINPVYDAQGNDISDEAWQKCELAFLADDPHTGGKAIRMGFTLLDEADFTADPASSTAAGMFDVSSNNYADLTRYDQFKYVRLKSESWTDFAPSGTFRFLRPDGTKSQWYGFPQVFTAQQLREETQSSFRISSGTDVSFRDNPLYSRYWFDRFPVIEFVPSREEEAGITVEFFGGHLVTLEDNDDLLISEAEGVIEADDLPQPRPAIAARPDGQLGLGAARGDGPATYGALVRPRQDPSDPETAALSVRVHAGSITIGDDTCTAVDDTPCDLTWTREEAWTAAGGSGNAQLHQPVNPIPLVFFPSASPGRRTISASVLSFDGTGVGGFWFDDYLSPTAASLYEAGITGALEQDADGIAAPGASVPLTIGFQINAGSGTGSTTSVCTSTSAHPCALAVAPDSYLVLSGPATWVANGGRRLAIDGTAWKLACTPNKDIAASREFGTTCHVVAADGTTRPEVLIASDADEDVTVQASLSAADNGYFYAFVQDSPGATFIGLTLRRNVFGAYTLKVGAVKQLAEVTLTRAPVNGAVSSSPIPIRSANTKVRLALLSESGRPSELGSVSSITFTAVGGGSLSGYGCSQRSSCTLSLVAGDATAADNIAAAAAANPAITGSIDMTYIAPTTARSVRVRAVVVGKDGGRFIVDLPIIVSGSAAELAIGSVMPRVHSSATDDDRDTITIPVTAQDANGNPAPIPVAARVVVSGVDGAAVPAASHSVVLNDCNAGRYKCSIVFTVTASTSSPLASGAYTARVLATGLNDARASFAVAGPVDKVSLDVPDELGDLGETFTATATAVDAAGVPVADGTWISFNSVATLDEGSPAAAVTSPALEDHDADADTPRIRRARTVNGEAAARITIVGNGISILSAQSGAKSASVPLNTQSAATEPVVEGADAIEYGSAAPPSTGVLATYRGTSSATAADALALAPEGATIIWLWNGVEWVRYGEVDGTSLPGSANFIILPGDAIFFGG